MMSNKYKTAICKHFEQSGQCHMGAKCHFAHGKGELRGMNDPLPSNVPPMHSGPKQSQGFGGQGMPPQGGAGASGGNFKTAKCKYFEKGFCKYSQNCSFAHGDNELRSSNNASGPQGGNPGGAPSQNMMGSVYDQSIQNQVAQQQIQSLGTQMETYHANDQELLATIKQAQEMNNTSNVQGAASLLYGIINRTDKSKEDNDNYAVFVYNIQTLGNNLYQQLQMQQYQAMGSPQVGGGAPAEQGQAGGYGGYNNYKQGGGYQGQGGYQKEQGNAEYFQGKDGFEGHGNQSHGGYGGHGGHGGHGGYGGYGNGAQNYNSAPGGYNNYNRGGGASFQHDNQGGY